MKIDDFQARLRAIYDGTIARAVEAKRVHDEAIEALFDEAERDDAPSADEIGAVVNAETARFNERARALQAGG